ncbi:MAG: HEPN domain-containing protein [Anaerolineae bacterium]
MSLSKNWHQAERWLHTAQEDLAAVQVLAASGFHAQACFYAQQSAEKAVKPLWYLIDADPWGHSVRRLLADFPELRRLPDPERWLQLGALLDQFYIPTRYPNSLPDLTPGQVYSAADAERALDAATTLVRGCEKWLQEHRPKQGGTE